MKYKIILGVLVCAVAWAEVKIVPQPKELRDEGRECCLAQAGGTVIVIGTQAGETELAAAERLQTLILRRFKLRLEIVDEADGSIGQKQQILLGLPSTHSRLAALLVAKELPFSSEKLGPDGYLLEMVPTPSGDTVVIAGGGPRGVLYGQDTFFDLLAQRGNEIVFPAVSVCDWPSIPRRGWPHFVLAHLLEPGGLESCVRARLNFTDARDDPGEQGSLVGKPRAALMGCPAGIPLDQESMGLHITNAHRHGFFVYGTVACAEPPERYDQVLSTYRELLALGVDGLWISFDDSGSGTSPCAIIQQVLALGVEYGISGRSIAITPPLGDYQTIDRPLNREMAAMPGMADATWFFTRVPCAEDRAMARDIGLTHPPAWWHNLVSVGSGFTHSGQIFAPLRKGDLPGYLELQPLSSGWGRPSYDSIRTAPEHTDTAMLWGLSWGYPFEYQLMAMGYWAWNPEQHDWQDTRAAIYRHIYGPSCVADACSFDDQMGAVKKYFELPGDRYFYKSTLWPWRLKSLNNRDNVFNILDEMDAACMRLTLSARQESALDAARLERYYLEPMSASLRIARAMAEAEYPEYTLPLLEYDMLDLLETGEITAAEAMICGVQTNVLPGVEEIRIQLDELKVMDPYVEKWQARLSGLDYWHNFREGRMVDMRALFSQQMRRPASELLRDRTEVVTEEDLHALFNAYNLPPAGDVLNFFAADAWLERPPVWRGTWGAGLYTNGSARTVALVFPDRTISIPGEYVEISATIDVPFFVGRLLLDLFVQDSRQTNKGQGYRILQLFANQSMIWSEDIVMDRTGHEWVTVDITEIVQPGEKARLSFRVEDLQPVGNLTVAFAGPFQLRMESDALIRVTQGSQTIETTLEVPSDASVVINAGATLTVQGAVTGPGSLLVTGGGTLILTDGPACAVPVTLDNVTMGTTLSTVFSMPLTLGPRGAILAPATGNIVAMATDISGPGGLTKRGSSILSLEGINTFTGETFVRNGMLLLDAEPAGPLVIGEGTLKYTGADAIFSRGYTLRTSVNTQAATIDTDTDITFNGPIMAENGAFIKLGSGTLTYAYAGENVLNAGQGNLALSHQMLNLQPYGDSPTQGYRGFNIYNGKVVMGVAGQTNSITGAIVIGGYTTEEAGAETTGHLEINGGVLAFSDFIALGRGNGTSNSAPEGLESTLTINGGDITCNGMAIGTMLTSMSTVTTRPLFTLNSGTVNLGRFYCGDVGGTSKPRIKINGGTLTIRPGGWEGALTLAKSAGCTAEMTIAGGTVIAMDQAVRLADNKVGAQGTLSLDGGCLAATTISQGGANCTGIVNFNGGMFQPSATGTMEDLSAAYVQSGGACFDVAGGITYTVAQPLLHDQGLGAGLDGGVTKSGLGTLVLTGANTYTGPTVVSNGTLVVDAAAVTAPLIVTPGGMLSLTMPGSNRLTVQDLSLGELLEGEAGLTISSDPAGFTTGAVAVDGDLFLGKTAVTLMLRGTSEPPSANGTYVVLTCSGTVSGDALNLRLANGIFGKTYTFAVVANELRLIVGTDTENSVLWQQSTGGDWSQPANWVTAPMAGAAGMTVGFMGSIITPSIINIANEVRAGTLLFKNVNAYTLSGTGSLTLSATNGSAALSAQLGAHTVAIATELESDTEVMTVPGAELSLTGQVTGDGKLMKSGDGGLRLSADNTYAGGTAVNAGALAVEGANALGIGPVVFNGGSLVGKGIAAVTVANDVSVLQSMTLATHAPLTLAGDWISSGSTWYSKISSNELTVAGLFSPLSGSKNIMEIREGSVRFAAGAEALFTHDTIRNSIDFSTPASASVVRKLTIESGAQVTAGCLYVGYGASNIVSITGGTLMLQGASGHKDALLIGTSESSVDLLEVLGGSLITADGTWSLIGVRSQQTRLRILDGIASFSKLSLGVRDHATHNVGAIPLAAEITVDGGLLAARQRWNWMGEWGGMRINTVTLNNGRLRLPATFASIPNRFNQSRLVFNGGVLETVGGGSDPEDPSDYLKGLKQAYVGIGGAVIDTCGRSVALAQRLTSQDVTVGGVVKCGMGALTLVKPCVAGVIDVQAGTLKFKPEESTPYPDDPMVRLSFENDIQQDDSAYNNDIELLGSIDTLSLVDGVRGTNALGFNAVNALYVNYRDDMKNADCYTVSAWVRQSAYQTANRRKSFFSNMSGYYNNQYDFLLRIQSGNFRMLATGQDNVAYGNLTVDVVDALPLDTWKMLTLVVDGLNGFSMYVDGEKRIMRVSDNGVITNADTYGAGKLWMLQPIARVGGKAFNIGAVATSDTECFVGDLDDVTVYRRALNDAEIALLYQAKVPFASRVRVASGAILHLAGATQEMVEVTGEGSIGNGTAIVTDSLNPGDFAQSAAGALLTVTDNLTLGTNVTYICDWTSEKNDLVDVRGTLTVTGSGTIDFGLTDPSQMPGAPRLKSFPVMYYADIIGAENFSTWRLSGIGRSATASILAADGVVTVTLDVHSGALLILR